jgi:hypothetical protein
MIEEIKQETITHNQKAISALDDAFNAGGERVRTNENRAHKPVVGLAFQLQPQPQYPMAEVFFDLLQTRFAAVSQPTDLCQRGDLGVEIHELRLIVHHTMLRRHHFLPQRFRPPIGRQQSNLLVLCRLTRHSGVQRGLFLRPLRRR